MWKGKEATATWQGEEEETTYNWQTIWEQDKTASEGSREIEAARKRLAAAKTQLSMAGTMLNAAKKEEREATEMLKDAEKRWEVIDID